MRSLVFIAFVAVVSSLHCQQPSAPPAAGTPPLAYPGEKHLRNIRQLTFGEQNAEAYRSAEDKYLIFQTNIFVADWVE
jgi:TolB protein